MNNSTIEHEFLRLKKLLSAPIGGEAKKIARIHDLQKAEKDIEALAKTKALPIKTRYLHTKVAVLLGKWNDAIEHGSAIANAESTTGREAALELAIAYRELGKFDRARSYLAEAESAPALQARCRRERAKLVKKVRLRKYELLGRTAWTEFNSGSYEAARTAWLSGLRVHGIDESILMQIEPVFRAFEDSSVSAEKQNATPFESQIILTSGSGYSGTGAVTAFLRQVNDLADPYRLRELSILKATWGANKLLKVSTEPKEKRVRAVTEFIVTCVLGLPRPGTKGPAVTRRDIYPSLLNAVLPTEDWAGSIAPLCIQLIHEFRKDQEIDNYRSALRVFLNTILRVGGESGQIMVNNCVHQALIHLCDLLDNAITIVVIRDPRDQFVSRNLESPRSPLDSTAFLKKRKKADRAVDRYLGNNPENGRIIRIWFEDFVGSEESRMVLLERLGINPHELTLNKKIFDPDVSVRNVGIHKKWHDQRDISKIADQLPDRLFRA